jgi:putative membrane protein
MNAQALRKRRREPDGMNFLKTLFWVLVAVVVVLFASRNWAPVTLNLWGDIQADVKIPILMLIALLLGWLPTWLVMRAKLWAMRRRVEALERQRATEITPEPVVEPVESPVI